jgi:hypothetical protein
MLDYTEEWYYSGEKADADSRRSWYSGNKKTARKYGRVLVIHGEPGDGKTTFCKKAVYAHCLEGWLNDVPHVLRISLNPADNETIIRKEKNSDGEVVSQEVFLSKSLCLGGFENNYLLFNPENLKNQEGTLVIFDGYDELDGELGPEGGYRGSGCSVAGYDDDAGTPVQQRLGDSPAALNDEIQGLFSVRAVGVVCIVDKTFPGEYLQDLPQDGQAARTGIEYSYHLPRSLDDCKYTDIP